MLQFAKLQYSNLDQFEFLWQIYIVRMQIYLQIWEKEVHAQENLYNLSYSNSEMNVITICS